MAGIVQMLHALYGTYDKYPYANPEGIRQAGNTGDQTRSSCTVSTAVPGPCHTVLVMPHHTLSHRVLTCPIWPILHVLLNYRSCARNRIIVLTLAHSQYSTHSRASHENSLYRIKIRCQKICGADLLCKSIGPSPW